MTQFDDRTAGVVPKPLRSYLSGSLDTLDWRWRGPSMRETILPIDVDGWRASLFAVRPGGVVPPHTHVGSEYTLVLTGGLTDRNGGHRIAAGDVEIADGGHTHRQIADNDGDCLCLAVLDAPVKLSGPLGLIANPFMRF